MSSGRVSSWISWIIAAILLVGAAWMWLERQYVVDAIQYYQYQPTASVKDITKDLSLSGDATFTFYATHPSVEDSETFNQHCQRKEANSPILGCYDRSRIYIFNVTDQRLDGMKEVTAAHELLHAEYERLSSSEKDHLEPLLQKAYDSLADSELKTRMAYYEKTEPGEMYNELHSIIGTEFASIGDELEEYYHQYFNDRQAIVKLHTKVDTKFTQLSEEADMLVSQINKLADSINTTTKQYNDGVASLNRQVAAFNSRANQPGGFASQADFQAERDELLAQKDQLDILRQKVQSDTASYKKLLARLDAINTESASLNKSIDSVLSEEPEI